ncbi:GtrA family protein [Tessaracoccus sp. OS52]|uniref:GtrA family protein n=1 Tax=Tessaracoccus sp. OS52 TaxID=2886691 RepID=UPI001D11C8E9|nr:GtrA family protein [Tessaracoccus sp. OS52]MCC2593254.1 GtrA family protein [Tessaracoccus sp. OS52]
MEWFRGRYRRYETTIWQFFRFGVVGGLGVFVNFTVFILAGKLLALKWAGADAGEGAVWWDLPFTDFNVRWYHVKSTIAFFVANVFNFQLNRRWTFRSHHSANWAREYFPFLTVGLIAQGVGLLIMTALMMEGSPVALPRSILDDSTGLRTREYWAQLIMILCTIPITFLVNKFWTFKAIRTIEETEEVEHPEDIQVEDV